MTAPFAPVDPPSALARLAAAGRAVADRVSVPAVVALLAAAVFVVASATVVWPLAGAGLAVVAGGFAVGWETARRHYVGQATDTFLRMARVEEADLRTETGIDFARLGPLTPGLGTPAVDEETAP